MKKILLALALLLSANAYGQHLMFRNIEIDGSPFQLGRALEGEFIRKGNVSYTFNLKLGDGYALTDIYFTPESNIAFMVGMRLDENNDFIETVKSFTKFISIYKLKYGEPSDIIYPEDGAIMKYHSMDEVNEAIMNNSFQFCAMWRQDFGVISLDLNYLPENNLYIVVVKYIDSTNFEILEKEHKKVELYKTREFMNGL